MTIVLVTGGRHYKDTAYLEEQLDAMLAHYAELVVVVGDCSTGVDWLAFMWCCKRGVPVARCYAHWRVHGKAAGPKRNAAMVALCPQLVVAFPGGPGTADTVAKARAAGLTVYEV